MIRWEYLAQVVRTTPDGMGGTVNANNNLYATNIRILQRTDDGQFPVYEWVAVEVNPRTPDFDENGDPIPLTGLQKIYTQDSIATIGAGAGSPVGVVDDSMNLFGGITTKVSQIVETTPGDEIPYTPPE